MVRGEASAFLESNVGCFAASAGKGSNGRVICKCTFSPILYHASVPVPVKSACQDGNDPKRSSSEGCEGFMFRLVLFLLVWWVSLVRVVWIGLLLTLSINLIIQMKWRGVRAQLLHH